MARQQPAVLTDEGLLLPVRPPGRLLLAGLVVGTLLLLAVAVGLVVLAVTRGQWSNLIGVVVLLVGAALFGSAARAMARTDRSGSTGLLLTPQDVWLTDRPVPVAIPWEGITAVEDTSPLVDDEHGEATHWLAFVLRTAPSSGLEDELRVLSGSVYPSIDGDGLAAGSELAGAVCRFYLAHPEERPELLSAAALVRFASLG